MNIIIVALILSISLAVLRRIAVNTSRKSGLMLWPRAVRLSTPRLAVRLPWYLLYDLFSPLVARRAGS